MTISWLIALRHGESAANAAFAEAERVGASEARVDGPDAAVGLTPLGRAQSARLGRRLAELPEREAPDLVLCSTYVRARETLRALGGGFADAAVYDERLRDHETGVLELLTERAVRERFPEEHARRERVGDFLYRPPGGESMADVALRVRAVLADLRADPDERRVMIVAHDSVVTMLRYVLEGETAAEPIANASLTRWRRNHDGRMGLVEWNSTFL